MTGPHGVLTVYLVSEVVSGHGQTVDATYGVVPPGGSWTSDDNGTYTVVVRAGTFADAAGNANIAATLGSIEVTLSGLSAPTMVFSGTAGGTPLTGTGDGVSVNGRSESVPGSHGRSPGVLGGDGEDTVPGGEGHDRILGGAGRDWVYAEEDKDRIGLGFLGVFRDTVDGGAGSDISDGDAGDVLISAKSVLV